MRGFEFARPAGFAEAARMLDTDEEGVRAFAGGTALMLMLKSGVYAPTRFVHLGGAEAGFSAIAPLPGGGLRLGALATLAALEHNDDVRRFAPVVSRAMTRLANPRVRNVATVGGALAHGDPHMDLPPVLASLGGVVDVAGPKGARAVKVEDFYKGYYETALERGELIAAVELPSQAGWRSAYRKCATRAADDWPAVGIAVSLKIEGGVVEDARLMLGAAVEKLTRLRAAEAALRGGKPDAAAFANAAEAAAGEARTIDGPNGSAAYKTALLRVHLVRALNEALAGGAP